MSKEDHISNLKDSILSSITKDIAHENEIIKSHKERQTKIIEKISNFKQNMNMQILQLEKQITEANVKKSGLEAKKNETIEKGKTEIKNLQTDVESWQAKNAEAHAKSNMTSASQRDELEKLMSDIKSKTDKIAELTIEQAVIKKQHDELSTQKKSKTAFRDKLLQECTAIENSITTENAKDALIAQMQKDHTIKILVEIEALKVKTDELQTQIMTSSGEIK